MKRLLIITYMFLSTILCYCQEFETLDVEEMCELTTSYINPSDNAKQIRSYSLNTGRINMDLTECNNIPDSLVVAINIAKDIWSSYLPNGANVNFKILYKDLDNIDIKTSLAYNNFNNFYYPSSLYRLLTKDDNEVTDATITINSQTAWQVGTAKPNTPVKNLSYALLKSFAQALGFGSSLSYDSRRKIFKFNFTNGKSIFDSLLFTDRNVYLKDIANTNRVKLEEFVKQENNFVYFKSKNENRKIYAPSTYNAQKSLKSLFIPNSLMSYKNNEKIDLIVDSTTINILNDLGWSFYNDSNYKIIGENIAESGITTAYQDHKFYIFPTEAKIENPSWEYYFPLKNGEKEIIKSTEPTLTIPAITEDIYAHTLEGDINVTIVFKGKINGQNVSCKYNLTLELKPSVLKAKVINRTPSKDDYNCNDIDVDVFYEGCHYLDAYVEEENSFIAKTYFSDSPFFTRLHLKDVDSNGYATLYITLRNQYGEDTYVIDDLNYDSLLLNKIVKSPKDKNYQNNSIKVKIGDVKLTLLKENKNGHIITKKILSK